MQARYPWIRVHPAAERGHYIAECLTCLHSESATIRALGTMAKTRPPKVRKSLLAFFDAHMGHIPVESGAEIVEFLNNYDDPETT